MASDTDGRRMTFAGRAFAADGYQTNLGPTPLDGSNRANVLGRGAVLATLDGNKFTLHGAFAGLATPATDAHLCMGDVMGGTGPSIYDVDCHAGTERRDIRHRVIHARTGCGVESRQNLFAARQPESAKRKFVGMVPAGSQDRRPGCSGTRTLVYPEYSSGQHTAEKPSELGPTLQIGQ